MTINNMLSQAVRWDYIKTNPNERIEKPKRKKAEVQCYSPDEVDKLLEVLPNEPLKYQAIILLALDLGCRRGDLTGLTWDDIDFNSNLLTINKTSYSAKVDGKTQIIVDKPKTKKSNRVIPLPNQLVKLLKIIKKESNQILYSVETNILITFV